MVRKFFEDKDGIQELDVIGFVAPASLTRLTPTQIYIFDSLLSIFGNDVKENINFVLTFSDSQDPPVLSAIGRHPKRCAEYTLCTLTPHPNNSHQSGQHAQCKLPEAGVHWGTPCTELLVRVQFSTVTATVRSPVAFEPPTSGWSSEMATPPGTPQCTQPQPDKPRNHGMQQIPCKRL